VDSELANITTLSTFTGISSNTLGVSSTAAMASTEL
jgi:hypothetical protein